MIYREWQIGLKNLVPTCEFLTNRQIRIFAAKVCDKSATSVGNRSFNHRLANDL
jgi:hypothetical protein